MFCPALLQWTGRFALEIDQVGIALHHQHLAQVQITVHPHQQAALGLLAQLQDSGQQVYALLLQVIDQRLAFAVQFSAMLLEQVQRAGQLRTDLLAPGLTIAGAAGARLEGRILAGCCQQQMHLTQALAQQGGKIGQVLQGIGVGIQRGFAWFQLVAYGPFQVVLGPIPSIALIAQIALGNHQQVRLLLGIDTADPAQQRRDIGKTGSGQKRTHFQFRVHAGVDPADQLEHQTATNHH
ncbi:hypothetical protein D3C79_640470 [compost metagenome]